jgi:hypothetical protein
MKQGTLFYQPKLDRSLLKSDDLAPLHYQNASTYYGWAISMALQGLDPCTPKEPMRLPGTRKDSVK